MSFLCESSLGTQFDLLAFIFCSADKCLIDCSKLFGSLSECIVKILNLWYCHKSALLYIFAENI